MANKKKNSNYVTEKTVKRKEAEAQKRKAVKTKKTVTAILVPTVTVLLVAAVIFTVMLLGGAFDYIPTATEHVAIELAGEGSLHVELYGDDAPITVKHFKSLVSDEYYDGREITAYIDGNLYFLEKAVNVTGIKGEFSENGVQNKVPFKPGTLVMARGEDYDSAYGRFFIVTENTDVSALDGKYAAFGRITDGIDVINGIVSKLTPNSDGSIPPAERTIIDSISAHDAH